MNEYKSERNNNLGFIAQLTAVEAVVFTHVYSFISLCLSCLRSEVPVSQNSVADRDEEKTPSKHNNQEMLPEHQTPPEQALKENEGYHTPTNPSPERRSCRTSTTDSTPEKKSTDNDSPTRVLRPRSSKVSCEVEVVESGELRSSPRLSESKNSSPSCKVVDKHKGGKVRERRLNSEQTREKASAEQVPNARTRSTSFSHVATCSKRGKSAPSPSQEVMNRQSPEHKSTGGKRPSPVQHAEKKRADVRTRTPQQESSGESSSKENQEPASNVFHPETVDEENVTRSRLRSSRQHSDENGVENKNQVKSKADSQDESRREVQVGSSKRTRLRPAIRENLGESCIIEKDCGESREAIVKEQSEHDIQMESPKRTWFRSSTNTNLPGSCCENKNRVESLGANVQEMSKQNNAIESAKTKGFRSTRKDVSKRCGRNEHLVESREAIIQEVQMESSKETCDTSVIELNHFERHSVNEDPVKTREASAQENSVQDIQQESPKRLRLFRSATKENHAEHCNEKEDVEARETDVREESQHDIRMEIPKRLSLRFSTKEDHAELCNEKEGVNARETNLQGESQHEIRMEIPKRLSLRFATKEDHAELCNEKEGVKARETNLQGESQHEIRMEIPKRLSLRFATKEDHAELCNEKEDVKEGETNLQGESQHEIRMESPKRSFLRSAAKENHAEVCDKKDGVKSRKTNVQEESKCDIEMESPKRSCLRSALKENRAELCNNKEDGVKSCETNIQEEPVYDIQLGSPKRSYLRSATRENHVEFSNIKQDDVNSRETNVHEDTHMESPKRSCLRSASIGNISESPPKSRGSPQIKEDKVERRTRTAKQPFDKSGTKKETKECEKIVGDRQENIETATNDSAVRLTRSRVQSVPTSTANGLDVNEETRNASSSDSQEPTVKLKRVDRKAGWCVRPDSSADSEPQRKTVASKMRTGGIAKLTDENETSQSSKSSFRGSEDAPKVDVKLSDCRKLCLNRKRPLLETDSDKSDTESIQLSSGETSSKGSPAKNTFSEDDENDVSSTPTLEHCPSPASSEKSGYSNETATGGKRYTLRRHAEHDDFDSSLGRRTRSKYKIPDDSRIGDRRRRKTISTAYTSVKSKSGSPKQRSQSIQSLQTRTPEKKVNGKRGTKSPENTTHHENAPKLKDPASESDVSTFSGSPRSGPIREDQSTRKTAVPSAVRNFQVGAVDNIEVARDASLLSDVSVIAVCGSPARSKTTTHSLTGEHSGIKLLEGSPRIKKYFHSAAFLAKHREQRSRVARLFESDDEEEDFYGFVVPQFDGSFSSEGDLSYKINSIVESMNGDTDQATLEDVQENTTIEDVRTDEEEAEVEPVIERSETSRKENGEGDIDKDVEIKQMEAARISRKRKSTSAVEGAANKIQKRNLRESQREMRSSAESSVVDSNNEGDADDFDEDDDVFSTVADSTDGEDDDVEVASPFSITSWTRKRNSKESKAEVSEEEEEIASSFTTMNCRRKRKSEDLQPEVERPTKRQKSNEGTEVDSSSQSSRSDTPVKSGAQQGLRLVRENNNEKGISFMSKLDELVHSKKEDPSFTPEPAHDGLWDEPVYDTLEERVKLRRIMNISRKEYENSQTERQQKVSKTESSGKEKGKVKFPPLKPLRKHVEPLKPLKPLRHVSSTGTSLRLRRINSSPSPIPSPLAGPRKSRKATWIVASPPPAVSSFSGRQVTCSTPVSASASSRHTLRLRRVQKH